jgi:hypothetical protein
MSAQIMNTTIDYALTIVSDGKIFSEFKKFKVINWVFSFQFVRHQLYIF